MRALERFWWRQDEPRLTEAWAWPLSLLSLGYRAGALLDARLTGAQRARAKVISVGNLGVGGAGKTPVAMFLCEALRARGHRPALLSRGYGRRSRAPLTLVCAGEGPLVDADAAGDEPLAIARRCPWLTVLVGKERARLARVAEARGADVLVLDDGLQHWPLARALDVIVLDAENPLGNGRRLPRGPLREGLEAFSRVGARGLVWLTNARGERSGVLARVLERAREAGLRGPIESAARARRDFVGAPTFVLSGIARPERFEETLIAQGARICGRACFSDHHRFSAAELAEVRAAALAAGARWIATTEKDAARIAQGELDKAPPIGAVPLELELLRGADELARALALAGPEEESAAR